MIPSGRLIARYFFVQRRGLLSSVIMILRSAFGRRLGPFRLLGSIEVDDVYLGSRMWK